MAGGRRGSDWFRVFGNCADTNAALEEEEEDGFLVGMGNTPSRVAPTPARVTTTALCSLSPVKELVQTPPAVAVVATLEITAPCSAQHPANAATPEVSGAPVRLFCSPDAPAATSGSSDASSVHNSPLAPAAPAPVLVQVEPELAAAAAETTDEIQPLDSTLAALGCDGGGGGGVQNSPLPTHEGSTEAADAGTTAAVSPSTSVAVKSKAEGTALCSVHNSPLATAAPAHVLVQVEPELAAAAAETTDEMQQLDSTLAAFGGGGGGVQNSPPPLSCVATAAEATTAAAAKPQPKTRISKPRVSPVGTYSLRSRTTIRKPTPEPTPESTPQPAPAASPVTSQGTPAVETTTAAVAHSTHLHTRTPVVAAASPPTSGAAAMTWEERVNAALAAGDPNTGFGTAVQNTPAKHAPGASDPQAERKKKKRAAELHAEEQMDMSPLGAKAYK